MAAIETGGAGVMVDGQAVVAGQVNASQIADGAGSGLDADLLDGFDSSAFWKLGGNAGTIPVTHFLGTTDNQPLELKVNGLRALRLEDNGDGSDSGTAPEGAPNVIGGSPINFVAAGVVGATIAGGGATNRNAVAYSNSVSSDFGFIGGGLLNTVGKDSLGSAIVGGQANNIADSGLATIAGGSGNGIGTNSGFSAIGGGFDNNIAANSTFVTIAGVRSNHTGTNSDSSVIGGGYNITIGADAWSATIAGGSFNNIGTNSGFSAIGGGSNNIIAANSPFATIPGGHDNVATNYAFAAGRRAKANHEGSFVWADTQNADFASTAAKQFNIRASGGVRLETSGAGVSVDGQPVIAGQVNASQIADGAGSGLDADLLDGFDSSAFWKLSGNAGTTAGTHFLGTTDNQSLELKVNNVRALRVEPTATTPNLIGGYSGNSAAAGVDGAVIGGGGSIGGAHQVAGDYTTISGGSAHTIQTTANYATISGGSQNTIQTNAQYSAIGGGLRNVISNDCSSCVVGGGQDNRIDAGASWSTIAGGVYNTNGFGSQNAAIGGGWRNSIRTNAHSSVIAGGYWNAISNNSSYGVIAGGQENRIDGGAWYATIAGGFSNRASGYFSFAGGRRAKAVHGGALVWADSQDSDFASTAAQQVSFRCNGGVRFTSGSGAANQTVSWAPGNASWSFPNDRNLKESVKPVDTQAVLERIVRLPVNEWNFKGHAQRHIGPMAQDFHAAFPLNENETQIDSGDLHGVALVAIQGLNQKLEQELQARDAEIGELKRAVSEMKQLIQGLAEQKREGQ